MFSKTILYGSAIVLACGTVLNTIGRFSPWMFTVTGPNVYNEGKNKVINGTINFGWFFLEACDGEKCYIQSMSARYNDHNTFANTTLSLFAETWHARRVGEQTIEMFAFFANIAGGAFCGLTMHKWQTKYMFVFTTLAATMLLLSASLEWANLGEVLAEMGSFIRYEKSKTMLSVPASFVLSAIGAGMLLSVSVCYYLGMLHTIYQYTDLKPTATPQQRPSDQEQNNVTANGTNDQSPTAIENIDTSYKTDQTSV